MPPARRKQPQTVAQTGNASHVTPGTPEQNKAQYGPITVVQKQVLLDNLQLEITKRARSLRAQYAANVESIRSKLEDRFKRIPPTLRSVNIEDLIDRYAESLDAPKSRPLPVPVRHGVIVAKHAPASTEQTDRVVDSSPKPRGVKRPSTEMSMSSDKENRTGGLDMPKKRAKTVMAPPFKPAPTRPTRTASRKVYPSQVLSPKSHNARVNPQSQSPLRASPTKSLLARPVSPAKPSPTLATASVAGVIAPKGRAEKIPSAARPYSAQAKPVGSVRGRARAGPNVGAAQATEDGRAASRSSNTSDTSAGTMIVKKPAGNKKGVSSIKGPAAGTGKKPVPAKKDAAAMPPAPSHIARTLRSRK